MSPLRGIGLKIASVFMFVVMSALLKACMETIPVGQTLFFRSICAVPFFVLWLSLRGTLRSTLKMNSPLLHLRRGIMGAAAMGLAFLGLSYLPLAEATAIGYAMPIFIIILAVLLLGEQIDSFRMWMVALAIVGILVILWPKFSFHDTYIPGQAIGALITLAGALVAAFTQIFIRAMVQTEGTVAIVFWFSVISAALAALTAPFGWVMPSTGEWVMLIIAGCIGGIAQLCLTASYRHADASVVASFEYVSMLFALAISWLVFAEAPTLTMIAGAGLIIVASLMILWQQRMARSRAA